MSGNGVIIRVDTTDLSALIERMRKAHTEKEFKQVMARAFRRTAPRVRTILRQEAPHDYQARPSWIAKQVKEARTTVTHEVACSIPVEGVRGYIGRTGIYGASASNEGTAVRTAYAGRRGKRTRRAYKINAKIVTSGASTLPSSGKGVHFMVFTGPHRGKVYARLDKKGDHIRPATGLGVPQMPTNRSRDAVQDGIMKLLKERIEHEHTVLIRGLAK